MARTRPLCPAVDGAALAPSSAKLHAHDVYQWLVRRRPEELPRERVLTAIRTAAGLVPLNGNQPSSRVPATPSSASKPQDVFLDVLLTCVELPASVGREQQRQALEPFLTRDLSVPLELPTSNDNSDAWWRCLRRARTAYFSARRAFFLVRIELLRIAVASAKHPHAALVQDVVAQLIKDGLVDALLDELQGRTDVAVPSFYTHLRSDLPISTPERHLRDAQHHWERQYLEEEALVRELLVLALYVSKERLPLARVTPVCELLLQWPAVVVPEYFSQHSLGVPLMQRKLTHVAALGAVLMVQIVHRYSQSSQIESEWPTIRQWTQEYLLREAWRLEVDDHHVELCEQLTENGVVLVAWATLLAKLYRRASAGQSGTSSKDIEQELQTMLQASEQAHGFQRIRNILRLLVQASDMYGANLRASGVAWLLPQDNNSAEMHEAATDDQLRVSVFQLVGATFLDDSLSTLGYVEHLEESAQLNAMVKLIVPVLSNPTVANAVLQDRPIGSSPPDYGSALTELARESRTSWPQDLVPGLRVLTALCVGSSVSCTSSVSLGRPLAVQLALKELSKKRVSKSSSAGAPWRPLPPDEYLEFITEQEQIVCRRTFAYTEDDRVVIQQGTTGLIDQDEEGQPVVQWQLSSEYRSAWETLLTTLETLVEQIQTQPLITIDSPELETFTSFLVWMLQASISRNVLTQILQQWAYARLKQWWREMGLPGGAGHSDGEGGIPALLLQSKVSLTVLQSASREDLVTWGVHDRFTREQILAHVAFPEGASSAAAHQQRRAASRDELERDALTHLVRMLLGFLDGFLNDHANMADAIDEPREWSPKQLSFISAVLGVLAKLTSSLDISIDVLIYELGGGSEECVQLILKSARKLFEYQDSASGSYPGLFASLTILMSVTRWWIAHEAADIANVSTIRRTKRSTEVEFRDSERHWLVATVEFVMEIVSAHETWKFAAIRDKWVLLDHCFRILAALLSASYHSKTGGVLGEFQEALRHTIISDKSLLMKILRSSSRLLATEDDIDSSAGSTAYAATTNGSSEVETVAIYPLFFEREVDGGVGAVITRESLVVTALHLLEAVMDRHPDPSVVSGLLTQRIDRDGIHDQSTFNLVTLCAGYLSYPLAKNSEIVHASIKMLQRAASAMSVPSDSSDMFDGDVNRSLVTLFQESKDLDFVRDTILMLVRTPSTGAKTLRKDLVDFLTSCLDFQPGFFALLVLEGDPDSEPKSTDKMKKLVGLLERLLESSDKLLDSHTDVLCSVLRFLCRVWVGGVKERRKLHLQIAHALRSSTQIWTNLTEVLRVRLPVPMDEEEDSMMEDIASMGRAGVYGSLARGLVLEIVAYEWHYYCNTVDSVKKATHPLVEVLDSFREEGLYAQWLRTFTRLDYTAWRFADVASSVREFMVPFTSSVSKEVDGDSVSTYHERVLVAVNTLKWQFGHFGDVLESTWKTAQWSALAAAHTAAQIYALDRWKVFMELYSLQLTTTDASESSTGSLSEGRKRKESMIASPPRGARPSAPVSPLHQSASASFFSGDRTSYGMIQVLSDVIAFQLERHDQSPDGAAASVDLFSLTHLKQLVVIFVSMLHHQIRIVLRKARDPKLSATRPRESANSVRLTVSRSIELLALVERTARQVFELSNRSMRAAGHPSVAVTGAGHTSVYANQVALWERLAGCSFNEELHQISLQLRSSLLTAALLLTRHIVTQQSAQDGLLPHEQLQRAVVVQVKLTQHAIDSIKLCDKTRSAADEEPVARLFRVSWSLLHALLDDFTSLTVGHEKQKFTLDAIIFLGPLLSLLQHETNGLRSLFDIILDRFPITPTAPVTSVPKLQACTVLKGLNAIVWNPKNAELCRHVMLGEHPVSGFSVLRFFAKMLVPRLRDSLQSEQARSGVRGYTASADGNLERSMTHQAWCSVLLIAAGLSRQLSIDDMATRSSSVWEFVAASETLLADALGSSRRLNRAIVEEQACVLTFLNALSATSGRRKQWREMLPKNQVALMEQSRLALRRACVLLGNSSYTAARKREQQQAQLQKKPRRLSVTAWPLSSSPRSLASSQSASLLFAHQTLLHEHLEAATAAERRQLTEFFREMETKLVHVVEQGSHLLVKWTSGIASRAATVAVQGSRFLDDEQLIPLLGLTSPSEALTMACEPSVGHLCIAMEFCVDELKRLETITAAKTAKTVSALRDAALNALQTSALLFFKTYLIHVEQHQDDVASIEGEQSDLAGFFDNLVNELRELEGEAAGRVDVGFFQQILKVVQIKATA